MTIREAVTNGVRRVRAGEVTADDLVFMELPAVMKSPDDDASVVACALFILWRRCEDGGDYDAEEFVRRAGEFLGIKE